MYKKPKLERFGTFRELTRIGLSGDGDSGMFNVGYVNDVPPPDIIIPPPTDQGRS